MKFILRGLGHRVEGQRVNDRMVYVRGYIDQRVKVQRVIGQWFSIVTSFYFLVL